MIAVDTNVLVYAHRREAEEHPLAASTLASLAAGSNLWAIPWPCIYEFFSVVTNRRIWNQAARPRAKRGGKSKSGSAPRPFDCWARRKISRACLAG
jgi:predicted nucleic acid-binding protein